MLLLEYRGYGLSEGRPSESGLYKDAQAGLDYLVDRRDIDASRIWIFGRSLGPIPLFLSPRISQRHAYPLVSLVPD